MEWTHKHLEAYVAHSTLGGPDSSAISEGKLSKEALVPALDKSLMSDSTPSIVIYPTSKKHKDYGMTSICKHED